MSSPARDDVLSAYLQGFRTLAQQLLTADDPYEVGLQLWGASGRADEVGELSGNLCARWGALTDWEERKPHERGVARAEMVRAAREWLAIDPQDGNAVDVYLDYWLHDVCGYERPQP